MIYYVLKCNNCDNEFIVKNKHELIMCNDCLTSENYEIIEVVDEPNSNAY